MSMVDIAQAKADALRSAAAGFRDQYHATFSGTDVAQVLEDTAASVLRAAAAHVVAEHDTGSDPLYTVQSVVDLLSLVDDEFPSGPVTEDEVAAWEDDVVADVVGWATAVHLAASDDDVQIPPMPAVLTERPAEDEEGVQ